MQLDSLFTVPRGTLETLRVYEALLVKWQKAINLVGPASIPDAWSRHFMDSIQIVPMVPAEAKTLYDIGSGAGFPGMVLAIARPDLSVTLIESDQKKCAFLTTVSHETKTPVKIESIRIEQAAQDMPAPDVISARALAALPLLLTYIKPWLDKNPGLVCVFPKGSHYQEELAEAHAIARFDVDEHVSITDSAARILVLRNIVFI